MAAVQDRKLFCSRQKLVGPKRRIANFEDVSGLLDELGFHQVSLGDHTAAEQAHLFHNAKVVLGGHGSDLANLLFCRRGTRVFVIEHDYNIRYRLTAGLEYLCEILGLVYHRIRMPTAQAPNSLAAPTQIQINEDYVVDPDGLRRHLSS